MVDLRVASGLLFCVVLCYGQTKKEAQGAAQVEDDSDMYMEPLEDDHQPASSNYQPQAGEWFPSFGRSFDSYDHPPSGHSRPAFYNTYQQQEGAYSQRNDPFQQDLSYNQAKTYPYKKQAVAQTQQTVKDDGATLLGDGNFGIIRGGTFYPEKDGYENDGGYDDFSSYFHNGHGRPSYSSFGSNPKPVKQQQFENFRDFADINNNAPPERQYSQYVVVYTNKNGSRIVDEPKIEVDTQVPEDEARSVQIDVKRPKNILESLALLDQVDDNNKKSPEGEVVYLTRTMVLPAYNQGDLIELPPQKKLSKSKRKLAKLLPEKKHEARLIQKAKDMSEPLLALS